MITINDSQPNGHVFAVDTRLTGMVRGDATIPSGRKVEIKGMVTGDLKVAAGASVEIDGMVIGTVINDGGYVNIRGMVGRVVDIGPVKANVPPGAVVRS